MLTAADIRNIPPAYDDTRHRYSYEGKPYLSSTQIVEKFRQPFDSQTIAARYAAKYGRTAEYWLKKWAQEKEDSLVRGNHIHDANEIALQGMQSSLFHSRMWPVHGPAILEDDPWEKRPDGIYTERMLWHHGYRIAGRADKIILESLSPYQGSATDGPVRIAHIEDYKTNKKLEKMSYQFSSGNHKMMKPPVAHLMDCNWSHYCLQLSLYMFMLEYQGFTPGTMSIIYYPHTGPREVHPVPYLRKEVALMLSRLPR